MKAKKFEKKLNLNKKTIANLVNDELGAIKGGISGSVCITYCIVKTGCVICEG